MQAQDRTRRNRQIGGEERLRVGQVDAAEHEIVGDEARDHGEGRERALVLLDGTVDGACAFDGRAEAAGADDDVFFVRLFTGDIVEARDVVDGPVRGFGDRAVARHNLARLRGRLWLRRNRRSFAHNAPVPRSRLLRVQAHAELVEQERQLVGLLGDALVERTADAVAGIGAGAQQDRPARTRSPPAGRRRICASAAD